MENEYVYGYLEYNEYDDIFYFISLDGTRNLINAGDVFQTWSYELPLTLRDFSKMPMWVDMIASYGNLGLKCWYFDCGNNGFIAFDLCMDLPLRMAV